MGVTGYFAPYKTISRGKYLILILFKVMSLKATLVNINNESFVLLEDISTLFYCKQILILHKFPIICIKTSATRNEYLFRYNNHNLLFTNGLAQPGALAFCSTT